MKIGNQTNFIVINKKANSLYSLIADGKYRATSLGHDTWKKLIGSQASLQDNCNKEGFNAVGDSNSNSIQLVANLKQESASLVTMKRTALLLIPESGLVLEGNPITLTRVVTRLTVNGHQIMVAEISKPWDISWCSKMEQAV